MSRRRSSDELKNLLVNAGLRVLYRRGLKTTASHVPMTDATNELETTHGITVTMGSIFGKGRLWANVGEFQLDLLKAAINDLSAGGPNDVSLALIHELPDYRDRPLSERIDIMVDLCRVAGSMNGYVDADTGKTRSWRLWVSIWAAAMNDEVARDRLVPSLRDEDQRMLGSFAEVYAVMLDKLRLRVRPPYELGHLALLAAAVTDGVALRSSIDQASVRGVSTPHDDKEWNLLGVGLLAIAREMLEDDPMSDAGEPTAR